MCILLIFIKSKHKVIWFLNKTVLSTTAASSTALLRHISFEDFGIMMQEQDAF